MKKMYFLTIILIISIAALFLIFATDIDTANIKFLKGYGIEVQKSDTSAEEFIIPKEFDAAYSDYNALQIEAGLNLSPYKGKRAVRYTYKVLNFDKSAGDVYANVICVGSKPVAADLFSPALDGFILPISYIMWRDN